MTDDFVIQVVAETYDGFLSVTRDAMFWSTAFASAPDLVQPHRTGAVASADVAVIVGIEDYGFLPDVPHASRDAEAVRSLLTATVGVPADRVRVLTSANREQLLAAAESAAGQVGAGGRVWWWFSGHGATSPTDGSLMMIGDDAKAQPDAFAARAVSVAELKDRLPGGSVVVVDACAAGRGRTGDELVPGTRFAVPTWAAADGITVWTAASASELAEPWPAVEHGLFTYLAVGALRGWADGANGAPDGAVDLAEAQTWVQRAIVTVGGAQHPDLHGPTEVRIAGQLEPDPGADTLPPLRARATVATGPVFVPPFEYRGGVFEDARGRSMTRAELVALAPDDAGVVRAQRPVTGIALVGVGAVTAGASLAGMLVSGIVHGVRAGQWEFDKASYESCLESAEPITTFSGGTIGGTFGGECERPGDAPGSLTRALTPWFVVGGAGVGLGLTGAISLGGSPGRLAREVTRAVE